MVSASTRATRVASLGAADSCPPEESRLSLLAACPLFAALPERVLRQLANIARRRIYDAEEALFRVGDPSDTAFVLCSGHVEARISSGTGRELVLGVAGPGEVPGELDLLDTAPRSLDAVAQGDVEVLTLPARAVRRALSEHPSALMEFSTGLAPRTPVRRRPRRRQTDMDRARGKRGATARAGSSATRVLPTHPGRRGSPGSRRDAPR